MIVFCGGIAICNAAARHNIDSLLNVLDNELEKSSEYVHEYELALKVIKDNARRSRTDADRYNLNRQLFLHYQYFQNDSAIYYLNKCAELANQLGGTNGTLYGDIRACLAYQCSMTGQYHEAMEILSGIDRENLDRDGLVDYYNAYVHVNHELAYYTGVSSLRAEYEKKESVFKDSLFAVANTRSEEYFKWKVLGLYGQESYKEAEQVCQQWLGNTTTGSHEYATAAFFMYLCTNIQGKYDDAKYYLLVSAISDIRNATRDQASLWTLAQVISGDGDTERAYRYIDYSWNVAEKFGTRMRSVQILPVLSMIEHNYREKLDRSNNLLVWAVAVVGIMLVVLLALLFYVTSQRNYLRKARNELRDINAQLKDANDALSLSNVKINESNRVKEEYIGRFLSLCSLYIKKIEEYRKRVNKMVKAKQYDELYQATRTTEMKRKELDELYANFDVAFIRLFPSFVDEFNALLVPEERIILEHNRLNTTIRIFALIRLGIDDSNKIAEFLDYSVHTVYNYRVKMRNAAICDRNDFERKIKNIGLSRE